MSTTDHNVSCLIVASIGKQGNQSWVLKVLRLSSTHNEKNISKYTTNIRFLIIPIIPNWEVVRTSIGYHGKPNMVIKFWNTKKLQTPWY